MDKEDVVSIGVDVGGTKISAAAVQNSKIISEVVEFRTPDNISDLINTIFEAIETVKNQYKAKFVGVATAGAVNLENSKVSGSTGNLPEGYGNLELKKMIEEKFNVKALIENDANAAAYAEYKAGNAKGHKNTIIITLGTGIGGGIIVDGKLLRGKSGVAAEVGHIPIQQGRVRPCTCGAWDCWEAYASGTGYAKNAQEMVKALKPENRGFLKDKNPDDITSYDVIQGVKQGDSLCKKIHDKWEELVLMGLVALVNIFDPESIVLSGGMAKFLNFEKAQSNLEKLSVISKTKLLPAKAANYAGIIGGAILAAEKLS